MAAYANYESGRAAAYRLLAGSEYPDAIFCADDVIAMAVMDVIRKEFTLCVPGDISVVGFHDIHEAALPPYSLTTMRSPIEVMVDAAVDIIGGLEGIKTPQKGTVSNGASDPRVHAGFQRAIPSDAAAVAGLGQGRNRIVFQLIKIHEVRCQGRYRTGGLSERVHRCFSCFFKSALTSHRSPAFSGKE